MYTLQRKKNYNQKAIHNIQWWHQIDIVSYAMDLALNVQDWLCYLI